MSEQDITVVTVRLPKETMASIERIMKKRKMKRSDVVRMCLGMGLDCHQDMEKLGIIGVVDLVYFMREALKEKAADRNLVLPKP